MSAVGRIGPVLWVVLFESEIQPPAWFVKVIELSSYGVVSVGTIETGESFLTLTRGDLDLWDEALVIEVAGVVLDLSVRSDDLLTVVC